MTLPVEKGETLLLTIPEGSKVTGVAKQVITKAVLELLWAC